MFNMLMSCPILMLLKMPVPFHDPSILFTLETFSNLYYVIMENQNMKKILNNSII